jgi:hypothetical protein
VEQQPDFFSQLGDQLMHGPGKAKLRAEAKRQAKIYKSERDAPLIPTATEKKLRDQARQMAQWRALRRRSLKESYADRRLMHGWQDLRKALRHMTLENGEDLIRHVRQAAWLREADLDTRHLALSIIASSIARLRERNGLEPFDDSNLGEEPTVFEIIREVILRSRSASKPDRVF